MTDDCTSGLLDFDLGCAHPNLLTCKMRVTELKCDEISCRGDVALNERPNCTIVSYKYTRMAICNGFLILDEAMYYMAFLCILLEEEGKKDV